MAHIILETFLCVQMRAVRDFSASASDFRQWAAGQVPCFASDCQCTQTRQLRGEESRLMQTRNMAEPQSPEQLSAAGQL